MKFTAENPTHEESLTLGSLLAITGTITPSGDTQPETGYRLFGLALAAKRKKLPKKWLVFELVWRNGRTGVFFHGYGPRKVRGDHGEILPPPFKTEKLGEDPIPFEIRYDGDSIEGSIGDEDFSSDVLLDLEAGEAAVLYFGMPPGAELKAPLGFEIDYTVEIEKG